ncbi:MAG: DUF4249 domain-containing protein [Cyclobacteriaceae bacterium]|nr:DUF4249 domain-containing protein [Cyclobacteriaceae bacterium]
MKTVLAICISIIGLFTISCEERIDDRIIPEQTNLLIVEGIITNEKINHRVKLSLPHSTQNEVALPATNAVVAIISSDDDVTLLNESPVGSGEYYTDSIRAVYGKSYLLYIKYNETEYYAVDYSSAGQPLDSIHLTETIVNNLPLYSLKYEKSGTKPNYITYDINWEQTEYCTTNTIDCFGKLIYYDLKNIDVQEIYAPKKEAFLFPVRSRIIRKKYSISDKYQEFLRSLLSETEWRGGLFDVQRSNVPTNLSEGAIGFFAVSTVVTDTVIVGI